MDAQLEKNKTVVRRFNEEFVEGGNLQSFNDLMHAEFINRTVLPGVDEGPQGMLYVFNTILRPAFPDLTVTIHLQVAEGDLVTTRKSFRGTHTGMLMGIPPTGEIVIINVIDIVRVRDGKYFEHWGVNTLPSVMAQLAKKA
jgi:predicted ester cyclase